MAFSFRVDLGYLSRAASVRAISSRRMVAQGYEGVWLDAFESTVSYRSFRLYVVGHVQVKLG
jgi:hypothetical protein